MNLLNNQTYQSPNIPNAQQPNNLPVVFFGSSKFVIPIIEVLNKNYKLVLVVTTERLASQGLALEAPVINYCTNHKIPYLSVSDFSNPTINHELSTINSPVAILADFGLIIPKEILNVFPKGILNIHPSLLPKYRGPTPVQTAILNGDKTTGVTIIKLDKEIDHGPILVQTEEPIFETDTSESLYRRLFAKGASLLLKVINYYLKGNLKPTPQNHKEATFTFHLTRQDGYLDISNAMTAVIKTERMVRAYYPWPGVFTKLKMNPSTGSGEKLKIIKLLPFGKIQVEGKKPVDIETFKRGYPETRQRLEKLFGQQG